MSWLSIQLPNLFKDEEHSDDEENSARNEQEEEEEEDDDDDAEEKSPQGGRVKEDLSELGKTIGRQLWGVASFLAPPPSPPSLTSSSEPTLDSTATTQDSSSHRLVGIRNDFAEISGSFKSGLSILSTNKAVNEISRFASNFLQFPKDGDGEEGRDVDESSLEDQYGDIVGITEEILLFVRELSLRPECWTDCPLSLDNDFEMSEAQLEHASCVEDLVPSLAALRVRLCPNHMKEGHFWMIYFILLHPRLNEHDSKLLSTPQVIEARDILRQEVQKRVNEQLGSTKDDNSSTEVKDKDTKIKEDSNTIQEKEADTVNAPYHVETAEQEISEKWFEEEEEEEEEEEDDDDDDETETSTAAQKQVVYEEDVSFSDLEDDDDDDASIRQRALNAGKDVGVSSPNSSNEWVQLSENSDSQKKKVVQPIPSEKGSEGEDWLTVDGFD